MESRFEEIIQRSAQRDKEMRSMKQRFRATENIVRRSNISLTGVPEEDTRENGKEAIFKEMKGGKFPGLLKDTHLQL